MKSAVIYNDVPIELLIKYDRPGPRYTSYPTAPTWSEKVGSDDYFAALRASSLNKGEPISLYCHIPYCVKRCYFCGCNTVIAKKSERTVNYVDTLCSEIDRVADATGNSRPVAQLHFGGGTPTFVGESGLESILTKIESRYDFAEDCERSIEIDPRVTSTEMLEYLVERGFNRISLGVQDFDDQVQKSIGRIQPIQMVQETLDNCRRLKLSGINFDLIYGLPNQTVESFGRTLDKVIEMRPDRLAVYSFAYLPALKPHQLRMHQDQLPAAELKYQLFVLALEKFLSAGYCQIGMDHFALPNDELSLAQADGRLNRNFMGYTVQVSTDMIGLGMSSIGYIDNTFFQNYSKVNSYSNSIIEDESFATYRGKQLSRDDLIRQSVISSLMCNFRLDFGSLHDKMGVSYREYFVNEHERLTELFADNLIREDADGLYVTDLGKNFVRNIAMVFDSYFVMNQKSDQPRFSRTI